MTPVQNKLLRNNHTECVICDKPLGQETRDLGLAFCHEHQNCQFCSEQLDVSELKWCLRKYRDETPVNELDPENIQIVHAKCLIASRKEPTIAVSQSDFDRLNLARLIVWPEKDKSVQTNQNDAVIQSRQLIANMDFEEINLLINRMEAVAIECRITLNSDPQHRKDILTEREKAKRDAERLAQAPKVKQNNREESLEIQIKHFTEIHEPLDSSKENVKKLIESFNKTVKSMQKSMPGVSEEKIREMAIGFMIASKQIKK